MQVVEEVHTQLFGGPEERLKVSRRRQILFRARAKSWRSALWGYGWSGIRFGGLAGARLELADAFSLVTTCAALPAATGTTHDARGQPASIVQEPPLRGLTARITAATGANLPAVGAALCGRPRADWLGGRDRLRTACTTAFSDERSILTVNGDVITARLRQSCRRGQIGNSMASTERQ